MILGSIVLQALPFAVTANVHAPILAFVLQVISGAGMIIVDVLAYTALQRDLPREVLGRVLGVFDAIVLGFIVAASFIGAALLTSHGLHTTLLVIGFAFPLLALVGLPAVLKADRESAAAVARLAPRVRLLGALDLFTGASNSVLERLAKAAVEQQSPAGSVIIREGDEADALWILVSGTLAIEAVGVGRADGQAVQLPDVQAPSYVGELGLLRRAPRSATVTTKRDSTLLRIDGTEFLNALEAAPPSVSLKTLAAVRLARTPGRVSEQGE